MKENFFKISFTIFIFVFFFGCAGNSFYEATNWPKQVTIDTPDPVLGNKLVWEYWIYGEEFAKRFEGFPLEKADKELQNSPIKAIVLRAYKAKFMGFIDTYPLQYVTDIELYFDDKIEIPLTQNKQKLSDTDKLPVGILPTYKALKPLSPTDKVALEQTKETLFYPKLPFKIFVTPLDNRFNTLNGYYHHDFLAGISYIRLTARSYLMSDFSGVAVPLSSEGALWLSLFGKTPYYGDTDPRAISDKYANWQKTTNAIFEPGLHPEDKGYIKLPKTFYKEALPKMTLMQNLNWCIFQDYNFMETFDKKSHDYVELCRKTRTQGLIFGFQPNSSNLLLGGGSGKLGF